MIKIFRDFAGLATRSRHAILFLVTIVLTTFAGLSTAQADVSHNDALKLRNKGEIVPLATLLDSVDARYPDAQILEVELEREDHQYFYEIELVTQSGEVRELLIDAASAEIIRDERDD